MTSLRLDFSSTSPHEAGRILASDYWLRPKLNRKGTQVLKAFFTTVSQRPTTAQKHELLEQILALEGNEHYDLDKISFWFQRRTWNNAPTKRSYGPEIRARLSFAGSTVLKHFFNNVSRFPTEAEKEALLDEVRALPDDGNYDIDRLTAWFVTRRHHDKDPAKRSGSHGRLSIQPSLTAEGAQVLETFFATVSDPPTDAQKHALVAQVCALPGNEHFTIDRIRLNDLRPRQRGRRPSEVTQILKLFFDTVSHYPSKSQRNTLLAQVRARPGKENYTQDKISLWFSGHRRNTGVGSRQRGRPRIKRGLTEQAEDDLAVCIRETPNPLDDLLIVWARALECNVDEIKGYIEKKRVERMLTPEAEDDDYSDYEDEDEEEVPEIRHQVPPLPHRAPAERQPLTGSQSESSVLLRKTPARQSTPSTGDLELSPMSVSSLPLEEMTEATLSTEVVDSDMTSLFDIDPAFTPSEAPTSRAEFLASFAPYEAQMQRIIAELNCQPY